jgi:tRNA (adenine-N(1)-)-methyltransferase non-catalytic subunit
MGPGPRLNRGTKYFQVSPSLSYSVMADDIPSQSHSPKIKTTSIIEAGDSVLIKLPNNEVRSVKVNKNSWVPHFANGALKLTSLRTIPVGRIGSFHANELLGQPYGLTYEIVEKKLKAIPPRSIQEVGMTVSSDFWV